MKISVGDYLLKRLSELTINHIFGVPGDYNLGFLDQIIYNKNLEWVGNCNELNAAYAADGYARLNGAAALVTTFGVGELSAINGIAGAYAEYIPIINIVGMPSQKTQHDKLLVHHTLGTGDFDVFMKMYSHVSATQTILTKENAAKEIDRVIEHSWLVKRPVYIGIPTDVCFEEIEVDLKPLNLKYPASNPDAVKEAVTRIAELVKASKNPIFILDMCTQRHKMQESLQGLIELTNIPFATMSMGKGVLNESHPLFLGVYNGTFSDLSARDRIESSDCIISFGLLPSDINTGGFSIKLDINVAIEMHASFIKIHHSNYSDIYFTDYIPALKEELLGYRLQGENIKRQLSEPVTLNADKISQTRFWKTMPNFLKPGSVIIAETGTSMFGSVTMPIPNDSTYICSNLWASIGYSVGALLGACLAHPKREIVLFVGDGSFQLTAQEISTIVYHKLNPIIFLINNDGYTIERVIHGPTMPYNDINMWRYSEFPKIFGKHVWTTKISNEAELDKVLTEVNKRPNQLRFIEVVMDKDDCPEMLHKIGKMAADLNKYGSDER